MRSRVSVITPYFAFQISDFRSAFQIDTPVKLDQDDTQEESETLDDS